MGKPCCKNYFYCVGLEGIPVNQSAWEVETWCNRRFEGVKFRHVVKAGRKNNIAFIHFYSMSSAKKFYDCHKNYDDGKVRVVAATMKNKQEIQYKDDDEEDSDDMGTGSITSASPSTSANQQQISSTSLVSSLFQQQSQRKPSSLLPPHPENIQLSTSVQAGISASPSTSMDDFDLLHSYFDLQIKIQKFKERVVARFKKAGIMEIAGEAITADNIEQLLTAEDLDDVVQK
ncbi:hypothetical protein BDA99DRAFT_540257 [Phascolomyces articulosus]|uniref:RRM domain-containing protein n=1 Tax=Phascolomyces articulosus TaxID=60185 RepID=A0AAD5K4U3_9FUNG|nr:hypothetical protein BDA99DRAFT_540257 [Phascolomyces articulosus]